MQYNTAKDIPLLILSIETFLNDFGLNLLEKHQLLYSMQELFFKEFNGNTNLMKFLYNRYRKHRREISLVLENELPNEGLPEFEKLLAKRTDMNRVAITQLRKKINFQTSSSSKKELLRLLSSYIHMSVNRLFSSKQRKHELLIYHLLERHYNTLLFLKKTIK